MQSTITYTEHDYFSVVIDNRQKLESESDKKDEFTRRDVEPAETS